MNRTESKDTLKKLSRREMRGLSGGVTRRQYCKTLITTYEASSVEKANAEWDAYKSAWDTHCAPYNM